MKHQASIVKLFPLLLSLLVVLTGGCTEDPIQTEHAYCDDSGCYECDMYKSCWPIPNAPCSSASGCQADETCTNIGCASSCTDDKQCNSDEVCITGYCAPAGFDKVTPYIPPETCKENADCSSDEFCDQGKCKPKCKSDDDCGPEKVCSACGKCQPKEVPSTCGEQPNYCTTSEQCGQGKGCKLNRCHFECTPGTQCPVGQVCKEGLCTDDPDPQSPECVINVQCPDGVCINGYCHPICQTRTQCGFGALCQMGVCQPDYFPVE